MRFLWALFSDPQTGEGEGGGRMLAVGSGAGTAPEECTTLPAVSCMSVLTAVVRPPRGLKGFDAPLAWQQPEPRSVT